MLTVNYGIAFQATDAQVRRLEPFYRLGRKTGARANESIGIDPTKPWAVISMLSYRTFYSTIAFLIAVLVVPTLQNASISVQHVADTGVNNVFVVAEWSRALTTVLIFNAICTALLIFSTREGSALLHDPRGIVGHLSMFTKSHILSDMRDLDTATDEAIARQLRHRRYILHKGTLWQGEYIRNARDPFIKSYASDSRPPMFRPLPLAIMVALQICSLALVPTLTFSRANYLLRKIPWALTALGVTVKLLWTLVDGAMRSLEPWHRLCLRHAPPSILTLDYTATSVYRLPFEALRQKHYLLFAVSIVSILAEVLVVCLSSFGLKGTAFLHRNVSHDNGTTTRDIDDAETFASFWGSFIASITILVLMICGATLVFCRRSKLILPRGPGTIASIMAYTHQAKFLYHLVDTETVPVSGVLKNLEKSGKTFGFGWYSGRDGEVHCGVDEEELFGEYRHGEEYKGSNWTKEGLDGQLL